MTIGEVISQLRSSDGIANSLLALEKINSSRLLLYPRSDGKSMVDNFTVYPINGKIALPFGYEAIRAAWLPGDHYGSNDVSVERFRWRMINQFDEATHTKLSLIPCGTEVVPFLPKNSQIGFKASMAETSSAIVRVSMNDVSGARIDSEVGVTSDKIKVSNGVPSELLSISKDITSGEIEVYSICGDEANLIHKIAPREKSLSYQCYIVKGCGSQCIIVSAKRKYRPYTMNDVGIECDIPYPSVSVFIHQIEPNKADIRAYNAAIASAMAHINVELEDNTKRTRPAVFARFNQFNRKASWK